MLVACLAANGLRRRKGEPGQPASPVPSAYTQPHAATPSSIQKGLGAAAAGIAGMGKTMLPMIDKLAR